MENAIAWNRNCYLKKSREKNIFLIREYFAAHITFKRNFRDDSHALKEIFSQTINIHEVIL